MVHRFAKGLAASSLICVLSGCALVGCRLRGSDSDGETARGVESRSPSDVDVPTGFNSQSDRANMPPNHDATQAQLASGDTMAAASVDREDASADLPPKSADQVALVIRGVDPGKGPVMIAVFDSAANFPNHENATQKISLDDQGPTIESSIAIAAQGFAIAAYQDQDGNGKLTKAAFGIPTEPYGFSNNAKGSMGPPSYQAAAVDRNEVKQVEITLTSLSF